MTIKPIPYRFFWTVLLALLTACGTTPQSAVSLTQMTMPTAIPTSTTVPILPTLIPTEPPPPVLTPDAIQVKRWKEYQTELAKALFSYDPAYPQSHYGPDEYKDALCEWDILGRSGQKVYVWAVCVSPDWLKKPTKPAVVYLEESDGSIREVKVAGEGTDSRTQLGTYDLHLFPMDTQAKLCSYYLLFNVPQCNDIVPWYTPLDYPQSRESVLLSSLNYRVNHPEESPLIVLSAMPKVTATPSPILTQPPIPILTPDAIQVERWKEYQTELAKALFSYDPNHLEGVYDPEAYKDAICEWDILGQTSLEAYIWAECISGLALKSNPTVIYLKPNGSIRKVNVARAGTDPLTQLAAYDLHLFPIDVQAKLCSYYFFGTVPQCSDIVPRYYDRGGLAPREEVLISHLKYRKGHPDEPPLVALSAIPKVTITPSPEPTAPSLPVLTPDAIQVERWKEYQTELAKRFVSVQPSEVVLCEWEILGRDKYELYVWAVCVGLGYEAIRPAVIHLEADGSIQNVETPLHGSEWDSDLQRMFPEDV